MPHRAFISFQMEDRFFRDALVQQGKDNRNGIEFVDYSVKEPWDTAWKTKCREYIARTKGTIVLIGRTTYTSEAVKWEIEETYRQGHEIFGLWTRHAERPALPIGLSPSQVIPWKFDRIVAELEGW